MGAVALLGGCGRIAFDPLAGDGGAGDGDADGSIALVGFSQIEVGLEGYTCGVFRGRGYCWGENGNGQLGTGDVAPRLAPTEIALPAGVVTQLGTGQSHACAIVDAAAWCWGAAALGEGSTSSTVPVLISGLPSPVTEIAAGNNFTCAIAAGDVYCWGDDTNGRLGNGAGTGSDPLPARILIGPMRQVFTGGDHGCAVAADGVGWCWGHNEGPGALGQGTTVSSNEVPAPVVDVTGFTAIAIGGYSGCGVAGGQAWCWGTGNSGELGDGALTASTRPVAVTGMEQRVVAIYTSGGPDTADSSCAIRDQALWCWGSGLWGRLGNRVADNLATPAEVTGLGGPVHAVSVGWFHTCAIIDDGEVACWGRGERGELGDGGMSTSFEPVRVPQPTL